MMNAGEKTKSAIVAPKPTNNAGRPVAEPVERRAETEGNAGQQRTRRAQDRESVSQALERIRQAARHRRKERFTTLFHHISPEMLRTAFFALKPPLMARERFGLSACNARVAFEPTFPDGSGCHPRTCSSIDHRSNGTPVRGRVQPEKAPEPRAYSRSGLLSLERPDVARRLTVVRQPRKLPRVLSTQELKPDPRRLWH